MGFRADCGPALGAAIIANATGSGATPYYYVLDQVGSVRAVVDGQGSVVERNDYYTYGKRHTTGRTYADLKNSPLLFSGKEDQGQALDLASGTTTPSDLRILDFGARHYDPIVPRWTTPDPLAEKYFPINTHAYCAGNPVNLVDPTGSEIRGNRKKDIQNVIEDLNIIFSDSVFDNFRKLIIQNGKKKNGLSLAKISNEDLTKAFDGITLNADQKALVEIVVNTINSTDIHIIEYIDKGLSENGKDIVLDALSGSDLGKFLENNRENDSLFNLVLSHYYGGGLTAKTKKGSFSVIYPTDGLSREVLVGHELLGHGRPIALGHSKKQQHIDAVQLENLIYRVMGIKIQIYGTEHWDGQIVQNYNAIPSYR